MKLRDFEFRKLRDDFGCNYLAIRVKDSNKWYEEGTIGETLASLPEEFADYEISDTRTFFNQFIIELNAPETIGFAIN